MRDAGLGALGAGLLHRREMNAAPAGSGDPPKIIEYRRLGRTEAMVSDIGSGEPVSSSVLKAVLDSGVNFVETSESYSNGRNEALIGNVMQEFERERLFIATKAYPYLKVFRSAEDVMERAEGSLKRLKTTYIDLYMVHQAQNIYRVKDDYFHKAADVLKKQGKIRFTGLSCHGPEWGEGSMASLEDILMAAIEDGRFDVIFLPYNFLSAETGERVMKACREHDIGTMIMKSNPLLAWENYTSMLERGRDLGRNEMRYYEGLKQAMEDAEGFMDRYNMGDLDKMKDGAIQFILSNPDAHTICCRFRNFSDVEKYIRLSGTRLDDRLALVMEEFRDKLGSFTCRMGCTECEKACPQKVPVNSLARFNYYFHAHGMEKTAMQYYRELEGRQADQCLTCEGYCEKACPHGVHTRFLLSGIHNDLNFRLSHMQPRS